MTAFLNLRQNPLSQACRLACVGLFATTLGLSAATSANAGGHRHHYDPGAVAAAGVLGLAVGAIAGSALTAPSYYPPYYLAPPPPPPPVYDGRRPGVIYYAPRHVPGYAPRYAPRPGLNYYAPPAYRPAPRHVYHPVPGTPEWIAYCARKYRSFNPRTGTYVAYSGQVRRCR